MADATAGHIAKLAHDHRICAKPDLQRNDAIKAKARRLASRLSEGAPEHLQKILDDGQIEKHSIVLRLNTDGVAEAPGLQPDEIDRAVLAIEAPFELRRRGVGKVVIGEREPTPDRTLLRALSQAHVWAAELRSGKPLSKIAAATGHAESYIRNRSQLAFISPEIQGAILEGRQPTDLTLERIIRKPIPLDWDAQARLYGFESGQ